MTPVALATGVTLQVATAGNPANPAIILLHGFPESHRTWRRQMAALAETHFVIAPDQRGYAASSKPVAVGDYAIDRLVADVIALADHFGLSTFTLAGHDWGGVVAWAAAATWPQRVARLIVLNAPHPVIFAKSLRENGAQQHASRYIDRIRATRIDRSRMVRAVLASALVQRVARRFGAAHLDEWSRQGALTGMLNWYRAVPEGAGPGAAMPIVTQPTLVIWGMRDRYLLPVQLDGLDALVPDLTLVRLDAGHFVTWRAAEAVTAAMLDWLT
ncbi:alpha/beta fold hydrolase [Sphingomonas immobilis]|uniref:Alpha/beta hydrolase n=1 Tax=Sphingomonas immobilis TaxID=3063997 RepID=A0ABT9A1M6_9SPHN|nr:alpha/beta hydrolase [Sphingomonas sp. CA1-15]MDO7843728.1 alpha/beta hydrolase [Sphingomonas sp. CA1-15]